MKYYEYQVLNIDKIKFSEINLIDTFFDSLKTDYNELKFSNWFKSKQNKNEDAFVYKDENTNKIEGFLYLKIEDIDENYNNSIIPIFAAKKRLKIGTFKITKNGYKMGERFLKIIFDTTKLNSVEEIYVTIIENNDEKQRLAALLKEYGFEKWGIKNNTESVYIKKLIWDASKDVQKNFPLINFKQAQYFCYQLNLNIILNFYLIAFLKLNHLKIIKRIYHEWTP